MPTFTYKARDNKGELQESSLLADDLTQAKAALKQGGLWVLDIKQIDKIEKRETEEVSNPFTVEQKS